MAARPPIMPPPNETEHSVSRITREGKQITYKLSVMQQPERARACGAGAKCTCRQDSSWGALLLTLENSIRRPSSSRSSARGRIANLRIRARQ